MEKLQSVQAPHGVVLFVVMLSHMLNQFARHDTQGVAKQALLSEHGLDTTVLKQMQATFDELIKVLSCCV